LKLLYRKRDQRGVTITELMMAMFASFIVVMGLGKLVMLNQQTFSSNQGKADTQSNSSLILSQMSKSIRESDRIVVTNTGRFTTFDAGGNILDTFQWTGLAGRSLQRDGEDMTADACTFFSVTTDADTLMLTLEFELQDDEQSSTRVLSQVGRRAGQGAAPVGSS